LLDGNFVPVKFLANFREKTTGLYPHRPETTFSNVNEWTLKHWRTGIWDVFELAQRGGSSAVKVALTYSTFSTRGPVNWDHNTYADLDFGAILKDFTAILVSEFADDVVDCGRKKIWWLKIRVIATHVTVHT
jgi:hypothetical protein